MGVDVGHDQPLEALHDHGSQCQWSVVIEACCLCFLRDGDDGGFLEARRDYGLLEREVGDVGEHFRQLVRAGTEFTAGDSFWACCFPRVDSSKMFN